MSETPKTIISDTSCFIVLQNIGELDLLRKVYGEVLTIEEVFGEFGESLPDWVKTHHPEDKIKQTLLELQLDKGEASAIALALETPGCNYFRRSKSQKNRPKFEFGSYRNARCNNQSKN